MVDLLGNGFPRLYAAASLKPPEVAVALGLAGRFPRLYAAASLKLQEALAAVGVVPAVFRGFMPRPH